MDVLVSLGTNASYLYSIISIMHHHFMHHHETGQYRPTDFFETSAMLITFILLGKYLEASAKGKTSEAIGALLNLTPPTAILLEEGDEEGKKGERKIHTEKEVPTTLIHRGDMLKVGRSIHLMLDSMPPLLGHCMVSLEANLCSCLGDLVWSSTKVLHLESALL